MSPGHDNAAVVLSLNLIQSDCAHLLGDGVEGLDSAVKESLAQVWGGILGLVGNILSCA